MPTPKTKTICLDAKLTWQNISRMYNEEAEQYGLSISSVFILLHIDRKDGTQVTALAPLLGMEASSMTRILNKLEDKGWITRKRENKKDRREVKIYLTPVGEMVREISKEKVRHFNNVVKASINPDDLAAFFRVTETVNQLIANTQIFKSEPSEASLKFLQTQTNEQ